MKKLKTKSGRLTAYGLACGYIEECEYDGIRTTLWHEGGPTLHVRQHDFNKHERVFWECFSFDEILLARKRYDEASQEALERSKSPHRQYDDWRELDIESSLD